MFRCVLIVVAIIAVGACKSRSDLRRDQEMERLKQELNSVKGEKVDISYTADELKYEVARLSAMVDENAQLAQRRQEESVKRDEELRRDLSVLVGRMEMIEQKELHSPQAKAEPDKRPMRFDTGKRLFDSGKFQEAIDVFRAVVAARGRADEIRKSRFMVAECFFELKDYASAALEYSDFKKAYPKDAQVPSAIYRQANSFRLMGRSKEARLFYQELFDKYPKHLLSGKGREELRRLK